MGSMRTAVAAPYHCQAGAARRRPLVVAAQREAPEAAPAAVERAEQGRAVLLARGCDWLSAAGFCCRSIGSACGCQQLPGGHRLHVILIDLHQIVRGCSVYICTNYFNPTDAVVLKIEKYVPV